MMKKTILLLLCLLVPIIYLSCSPHPAANHVEDPEPIHESITLPEPDLDGDVSIEKTLSLRLSKRNFTEQAVTKQELSQLLWAAQGTGVDGTTGATRTAPSAGGTHPMELFIVVGEIQEDGDDNETVPPGIFHYDQSNHKLASLQEGDYREQVSQAALNQGFIAQAPATLILAADYERTTRRYGERGQRYVHIEVGHITQNIHLQAEALELGSVAVGAFDDQELKSILDIGYDPLMIIPVGNYE